MSMPTPVWNEPGEQSVQTVYAWTSENEPAAQFWHTANPAPLTNLPVWQASQACICTPVWNRPAGHLVQIVAPVVAYSPTKHLEHVVCALKLWYVPPRQSVHAFAVLALRYEPATQAAQVVAPVLVVYVPALHGPQMTRPEPVANAPPSHALQVDFPPRS
jgi:hypothetical protein